MRQVVVFLLAGQQYGVDIGRVYEIIRHENPVRLPGMPSYVEGVIHVREHIIPVVDPAVRLGLSSGPRDGTDGGRILIVDAGVTVGLKVDAVQEVRNLTEPLQPLPSGMAAGHVEGIALTGDQMIIMLDPGKLFGGDEAGMLARVGREVAAVV